MQDNSKLLIYKILFILVFIILSIFELLIYPYGNNSSRLGPAIFILIPIFLLWFATIYWLIRKNKLGYFFAQLFTISTIINLIQTINDYSSYVKITGPIQTFINLSTILWILLVIFYILSYLLRKNFVPKAILNLKLPQIKIFNRFYFPPIYLGIISLILFTVIGWVTALLFGGIVGLISGLFVFFKSNKISKSSKTNEEKMKSIIFVFIKGIILFIILSILLIIALILLFMTPIGFAILYNPLFQIAGIIIVIMWIIYFIKNIHKFKSK